VQSASDKRIVWILFDELSYKLAFENPPPTIGLPNFRELRSHSVSFGNLQAGGVFTDRIVPTLIAGEQIDAIRSNEEDRKLSYFSSKQSRWLPFDQNKSLFGLAHSAGWNVGVEGWYNPYCRMFSSVLDACSWEPGEVDSLPLETVGASEQNSSLTNAGILVRAILLEHSPGAQQGAARRADVYSRLMTRARDLIGNRQINFVFIHLSVPHPPGFFDRKTHKMCACGNYIDNLVLADDTLGELLKQIDQSGYTSQTTLIVSSDHSWRVPIWRGRLSWTSEEEQLSQGRFDTRPVFLVHFPGQRSSVDVLGPLPELIEHDMIQAMLENKIGTPESLVSFLHPAQPPQGSADPASGKP
jgi:hypothetical protein